MGKDVVVIFVHGIGITNQNYYESMRDSLIAILPPKTRQYVTFRAVFWADIVRGRQQEYVLYATASTPFSGNPLHKLVIEGLGDAAAYQKTRSRNNSAYYEIQARLRRTIRDAVNSRTDSRPLIFIGHSLGCHIVSSYAWDLHKIKVASNADNHRSSEAELTHELKSRGISDPEDLRLALELQGASSLERLDTFAGFVTMGSNMPLFTFTFGPLNVHPISRSADENRFPPAFPGVALSKNERARAQWLNFYSVNDPLGYPLKPLNEAYENEALLSDNAVRSEGITRSLLFRGRLRQLNALRAHSGYWANARVLRASARLIHNLVTSDEIVTKRRRLAFLRMKQRGPQLELQSS